MSLQAPYDQLLPGSVWDIGGGLFIAQRVDIDGPEGLEQFSIEPCVVTVIDTQTSRRWAQGYVEVCVLGPAGRKLYTRFYMAGLNTTGKHQQTGDESYFSEEWKKLV